MPRAQPILLKRHRFSRRDGRQSAILWSTVCCAARITYGSSSLAKIMARLLGSRSTRGSADSCRSSLDARPAVAAAAPVAAAAALAAAVAVPIDNNGARGGTSAVDGAVRPASGAAFASDAREQAADAALAPGEMAASKASTEEDAALSRTLPKARHPEEEGPALAPAAPPPGAGEAPLSAAARQELAAAAGATAQKSRNGTTAAEAGSSGLRRRPSSPEDAAAPDAGEGSVENGAADGNTAAAGAPRSVEQTLEASHEAVFSHKLSNIDVAATSAAGAAGEAASETAPTRDPYVVSDDPFAATLGKGSSPLSPAAAPSAAGNIGDVPAAAAAPTTKPQESEAAAAAATDAAQPAEDALSTIPLPPALPFYRDQADAPMLAGATARVSTRAHARDKALKHAYHVQARLLRIRA